MKEASKTLPLNIEHRKQLWHINIRNKWELVYQFYRDGKQNMVALNCFVWLHKGNGLLHISKTYSYFFGEKSDDSPTNATNLHHNLLRVYLRNKYHVTLDKGFVSSLRICKENAILFLPNTSSTLLVLFC